MIGKVLIFLKDQLNAYLDVKSGREPDETAEELVVFVDGEKMDPIEFKLSAVSVLLISIEEEKILRSPNPYVTVDRNGTAQQVQPEIRLNLYVLFVARFKKYEEGLSYLSWVLKYFQSHRTFNQQNAPALSEEIDQLTMELVTLPFSEQNEVWNALRATYHPSILYKVKMVVFRDEEALATGRVLEKDISFNQ